MNAFRLFAVAALFTTVAAGAVVAGAAANVPVRAVHGMVVSDQALATRAGVAVLRRGGNAVDAAVAVGYALAVTDPCCGNIGGGGFMLIHHAAGGDSFVNFRERAPFAARKDMYLDAHGKVVKGRSTAGWLAVGVPGTVAGLERARSEYGTLSREQLLAPAIALARDGFVLSPGDVDLLAPRAPAFAKQPNVGAVFTHAGGPLRAGDRLRQPQLARTLEAIARGGPNAFYRGSIAARVVSASRANGGILTREDFARYTSEERAPVRCRYRSYTIVSAPPPSSGGTTMCEILAIVDGFALPRFGLGSAAAIHADVEAERLAYADRNTYLGDPDFVRNPVARLLSPAYISMQRAKIGPRANRSADIRGGLGPPERPATTHYSIVDRFGNAVAVTYTINDLFGAGVIGGDPGFLLNDEMDDFTSKPGVANLYGLVQGEANAIAPGKRPLSSMAPTIALRGGHVAIVAGSPGGSRIITITLGVLQDMIDFGRNVAGAVAAPRFHHQWLPDSIDIEPGAIAPATQAALRGLGYTFTPRKPWGAAEVIAIDPKTGRLSGASDPRRRSGLALGY
jgi:gamma-glutamyltranspeptidase/glutathione hydrolase